MTPDKTLFRIASCSKVFTSILIHRLIQLGKVTLSDLLIEVLDIQPVGGRKIASKFDQITIWDLLQMASGINPSVADVDVAKAFGRKPPITADQFASYVACQDLTAPPGSQAAATYNSVNYALLGQVIERLYGASYDGVVGEQIRVPLHLTHTRLAVSPLDAQPGDEAFYDVNLMPLQPSVLSPQQPLVPFGYGTTSFEINAGDGGLSASAADLARVLAALNITTTANPILSSDELKNMFTHASQAIGALSGPKANPQGFHGAQGWDGRSPNPGTDNWYAQKGGSYAGAGATMRLSMGGISMAFVVSHQPVGRGAPQLDGQGKTVYPDQCYPDWPAIIGPAESTDWGTTDLFPSYGMPSLPT